MAVLACTVAVSGCSQSATHRAYVSRPLPNGHVLLVPELRGGSSGWCVATGYRTAMERGSGCGQATTTSTGPIFDEAGCDESETAIHLYALTTSEVAAVSVYGGSPIPTTTNSTLPDGLRAAAVEVVRHNGQPNIEGGGALCPRLTPLDAQGKPISRRGEPGRPQAVELPGTLHWEEPARPAKGECELDASKLQPETVAHEGDVATRIRQIKPYRGLLGRGFLSCVDTVYITRQKDHLRAAVLLDATRPGSRPAALPGMRPVAGHVGIFEAPGSEGETLARRIPGAWLVVEEEDRIGQRAPLELLADLHAEVKL